MQNSINQLILSQACQSLNVRCTNTVTSTSGNAYDIVPHTCLHLHFVIILLINHFYINVYSTSRSLQPLMTLQKLCIVIESCQENFKSLIIHFDNNVHCTTIVITTNDNTYEVMHQNMIPSSRIQITSLVCTRSLPLMCIKNNAYGSAPQITSLVCSRAFPPIVIQTRTEILLLPMQLIKVILFKGTPCCY